ncbi:MAG: hypothetical protein U0Q16_01040 [Bryobacteraceae bacterium]
MRPERVLAVACLLLALVPAAEAKKKFKHPLGFRVELPDGWNVEPAELGATLLPPGVKVDPNHESNPEVYSVWSPEEDKTNEQEYIQSLRDRFKATRVEVDRGGDLEGFSTPGRPGVIYTFDFIHPERKIPYRVRVFAIQHRGRPLFLTATGQRDKLLARDMALRMIARSVEW